MKPSTHASSMLALAFCLGTSALAHAAGAAAIPEAFTKAPKPFTVVDATGKTLGRLFGESRVQMVIGGTPAIVDLIPYLTNTAFDYTKAMVQTNWAIYFASGDCSGAAYILPPHGLIYQPPMAATPFGLNAAVIFKDVNGNKFAYVTNRTGAPADPFISSFRSSANGGACSYFEGGDQYYALPVDGPFDINTLYVEPFSVQ